MLTEVQCKEIFKLVEDYRSAHVYLSKHTDSRRAHTICEKCSAKAWHYISLMKDNIDKITSEDVKCFALLVDTFEQMRRESLLKQLQKFADFDVFVYVQQYNNRGFIKRKIPFIKTEKCAAVNEMSAYKMDRIRKEYKRACQRLSKNKSAFWFGSNLEKYRSEAYIYAQAIVSGAVNISPKNLEAAYNYLKVLCHPVADGDVADRAEALLNKRLEQYKKDKPENIVENKIVEQEPVEEQKEDTKDIKFHSRVDELIQFLTEKDAMRRKEREEKIAKREQVKQERKEFIKSQKEKCENLVKNVSGKVQGLFGSVKSKIQEHKQEKLKKKEHDTKVAEAPVSQEVKTEKTQNFYRTVFVRAAASITSIIIFTSVFALVSDKSFDKASDVKQPVKKEIKEAPKPVVQQVQHVVPVDTAYMHALNNYCNSAMDIIAGSKKKTDVLAKIDNQVKSGNLVLNDSISAERVAYAYFIYREYGFKIDVLDLAVNSNQKLTNAQQAELIKVIIDAGEHGTGVQKMARQRVEMRGGHLGQNSKFEHATKAQQRQYLVNRGLLKKVHTK